MLSYYRVSETETYRQSDSQDVEYTDLRLQTVQEAAEQEKQQTSGPVIQSAYIAYFG